MAFADLTLRTHRDLFSTESATRNMRTKERSGVLLKPSSSCWGQCPHRLDERDTGRFRQQATVAMGMSKVFVGVSWWQ